jgi:hypothetical protein
LIRRIGDRLVSCFFVGHSAHVRALGREGQPSRWARRVRGGTGKAMASRDISPWSPTTVASLGREQPPESASRAQARQPSITWHPHRTDWWLPERPLTARRFTATMRRLVARMDVLAQIARDGAEA